MRHILALGALALVLVAPAGVAAQNTEWNRYTLDGLGGVFVRPEADETCEGAGVTASSIQADAAVRLLEADVPVLTEDEMLANVGLPELRITLSCAAGGDALGYSVSVRVQQAAQMIRDNQITLAETVTWYTTEVGVTGASGAAQALQEALHARLQEFAEAYVAANAEQTGGRD